MRNGGVSQQRQSVGNSNAIVTAQRSSLGKDKRTVVGHIQTVHSHINGTIRILLADHIHVALQYHGLVIFIAAGTVGVDDHIVKFILLITQTVLYRKTHQIVADGLGIAAAVGNGANIFKIRKYRLRLQTGKFAVNHNQRSLSHDSALYHTAPELSSAFKFPRFCVAFLPQIMYDSVITRR